MEQSTGDKSLTGVVLKHRYHVLEKTGQDGVFTMYRCEDKIEEREVALKVLLPQYAANRMFAERVLIEAQAMVGFKHPGIVEVYDSGDMEGHYYVITEAVEGADLRERLRTPPALTVPEAIDIAASLCEALEAAHSRGFIHGDIRPGNIVVLPNGDVKLADFWASAAINSSQTVRSNTLAQSVHYMAPEVAEGQPSSPAADIYSLGVLLFELVGGIVPFDGETPIAVALKHARQPVPSLRTMNPSIPKSLESIVVKAMQKTPDARFRSAKLMLNELRSVRNELNAPRPAAQSEYEDATVPVGSRRSISGVNGGQGALSVVRMIVFILLVVVLFGFAAVITYVYMRPGEIVIPGVIGKTMAEAEAETKGKIHFNLRGEQYNESFPEGQIYYMNPDPGRTVKSGAAVDVWISKGSKYARVPSVVDQALDSAVRMSENARLSKGEITQDYSSKIMPGNVMKQTPAPNTKVERGEFVSLVLSLGPEEPEVSTDTTTTTIDEPEPEAETPTHSYDVKFTVPPGPEEQTVRITVTDDRGETVVYEEIKAPDDKVAETVHTVGRKATIRIYLDDNLIKEDRK